jgi:hypothetical protein
MKSFDYLTSSLFLQNYSNEEKIMFYGAFGGTAMYLNQINSSKSFKENVINLFMTPTGYLFEEPRLLIKQELQETGVYSAIIEAIALGASKANEISTKTGEETAKCIKYINTLNELGILYKEIPFGEKDTSRKTLYGISDMMFRFWYRYVSNNITLIETDASETVWSRKIEGDYSNYMGYVFEKVCKEYLLRKNSRGDLPILFTNIGRWWGTDSKTKSQVEIDIVAQDGNAYLFGECKWRNEKIDYNVLEQLRLKANVFKAKRDSTYFALFSKSGFSDAVLNEAAKDESILLYSLGDLFA